MRDAKKLIADWINHYNQHTTLFNRLENSRGEIHIMCFYKSAAGTATML